MLNLLCCPELVPQMTGDALLLGAVKVKVSEAQSPMAPPVNQKNYKLI